MFELIMKMVIIVSPLTIIVIIGMSKADPKTQGVATARQPEPTPCHRGGRGEPQQADPTPDHTTGTGRREATHHQTTAHHRNGMGGGGHRPSAEPGSYMLLYVVDALVTGSRRSHGGLWMSAPRIRSSRVQSSST